MRVNVILKCSTLVEFFRSYDSTSNILFWHRKTPVFDFQAANKGDKEILFREYSVMIEYYLQSIPENRFFVAYKNISLNKLIVLSIANKFKIKTPQFSIISSKQEFRDFKTKFHDVITKAMHEGVSRIVEGKKKYTYTKVIKEEEMEEVFFPSLIQEKLDKLFDIRTFYFFGEFYSIAIFSQHSNRTKVDVRNYDYVDPNRMSNFNLSQDTKSKLIKVMEYLDLVTGSIDLVFTRSNQEVFLEINPVGQFGAVSKYGNYNLERIIAEKLKYRYEELFTVIS